MSVDHYENFPVASLLLPARLRPAVTSIYHFARSADDIADEGELSDDQRLQQLQAYQQALLQIDDQLKKQANPRQNSQSDSKPVTSLSPMFRALQTVIEKHQLPIQAFTDLISAFQQDVVCKRYQTYAELLDYCARSANPVGLLMLHLYEAATPENILASDAICSALQLINFCQDVAIDSAKLRTYLPLEDLQKFQISPDEIDHACHNNMLPANWSALMEFECQRARQLMLSGAPLCLRLPGRIGWELRLVVQGGLRILDKIQAVKGDVFRQRPVLTKLDWLLLGYRALRM